MSRESTLAESYMFVDAVEVIYCYNGMRTISSVVISSLRAIVHHIFDQVDCWSLI